MTASRDRSPSPATGPPPATKWTRVAIIVACSVGAIACGGDDTNLDVLQIEDVWSRPTAAGAENGAVYMTILSPTDDVLNSVAVDSDIAAAASFHETTTVASEGDAEGHSGDGDESNDSDGMDMAHMSAMATIDAVPISSGDVVRFQPGGLHVMLEQLTAPLETGERFRLTLVFRESGERDVEVVVGDGPP